MARGYNAEVTNVKFLEEGVCHVVQGRSIGHRAARAHRVVAASVMLLAAIVVCVALAGSAPGSKQLAESRLYSATGWDSIYGGGKSANSDDWGDVSGADNTGARHTGLHEDDDDDDDSFVDPDSAKGDHHWNAADDSTSKPATSSDDDDDESVATSSQKQAKKGPSSKGAKAVQESKAKTKADKLLQEATAFDQKLPTPKSRAEEKKQKAAQLANLLRIQKELASDYKKVLAKGNSIRSKGKKLGLMKDKATSTAELQEGDPFSA